MGRAALERPSRSTKDARVANPEHVDVAVRGAAEIVQWRDMHPGAVLDLAGAPLAGARLRSANLSHADLSTANLDGADLHGANLRGAKLRRAALPGADLSDADLNGADLSEAVLSRADLSRADFRGADLSAADLGGAFAIDTEFEGSRLVRVNLESAHLTRARFVESDLTDAIVENCIVTDTVVERLRGRPKPPKVLWFDDEPRTLITDDNVMLVFNDPETPLAPDRARTFFVEPRTLELVWERSFSAAAVLAYSAFQSACRSTGGWPEDVRFVADIVRSGRTVFVYEAPRRGRLFSRLRAVLEPFRLAELVDWEKTAAAWTKGTGEAVRAERPERHEQRRRLAGLLQSYEGFADNIPVELRTGGQRVAIEFRAMPVSEPHGIGSGASTGTVEFDATSAELPQPGAPLVLSIHLAPGNSDAGTVRFAGAH